MPLLIDNIEEINNDAFFDEMVEIVFPILDDMLVEELSHLQDNHQLSDSMIEKLKDSWLIKKEREL